MIERVRSSAIIWSLKKVGCQNWDIGSPGAMVTPNPWQNRALTQQFLCEF
jgi:hypothetical protein